ncbi:eukaryotic translation initiation factor 2D [Fopius arisanus]|uniref:Eukaryotic translation initiation factor 2D n=1 Tax=Fopius arisanus TaxID=64838 RepID=A0A9R1TXW6_9HYME|nr:PREDICTED: eukaryotic translation initiation factor 2D [Fopius arisanus]
MFLKPFKVKSNNQLKGTERKKLYEAVTRRFPKLSDVDIQDLLPKKELITVMKIVTHNEEICKLYCVAKVPIFFELDQPDFPIFPTIFTLWRFPDLLYAFTTHRAVVSKLASGASLMLPGVILDGPPTMSSYGRLKKHTPVSVNTEDNKAPVAVGITFHSSEDMYMCAGRGKCVDILHVTGDALCSLGKPPCRPELGPISYDLTCRTSEDNEKPPERVVDEMSDSPENIEFTQPLATMEFEKNTAIIDTEEEDRTIPAEPVELPVDPVEEMDRLLEFSFLRACKKIKKTELPILSSNFFKNYLIPACPSSQPLDLKKTNYKKLSVFLAKMKTKKIIDTTIIKGVESIIYIDYDNSLLKDVDVCEESKELPESSSNTPVITECYKITADVTPILSKFGYEKGEIMKRPEIRKCFIDYLQKENLRDGKNFTLNPQLANIFKTKESIVTLTVEDGINKFIGRMTHTYEISIAGTNFLRVGKLEPIDITVATRCNNKKVTLVNNLEQFGIKLDEFSKECQGIGASATITDVPGKKTPSVLIQGNQVIYVYKLLTESYKIHKNYIRGLEFAPKKRK